jgi:dienelactone hydrolase
MEFNVPRVGAVFVAALLVAAALQGGKAQAQGLSTATFSVTATDTSRGVRCDATGVNESSRSIPVRVTWPTTGSGHPILFVLHGFGQDSNSLDNEARSLASQGFVAVVPRFPLSSPAQQFNFDCAAADLKNQPLDVSFVLTELLARRQGFEQLPEGVADGDRVGTTGASGGGITGLLFFNSCCRDSRIDAVMSTIGYPPQAMDTPWEFDTVKTPLFMFNIADDPVIPYREARIGWEAATGPKFLVTQPGTTHGGETEIQQTTTARSLFAAHYLLDDEAALRSLVHSFDGVPSSTATFEAALPIEGSPTSTRLAGGDRLETAIAISQNAFDADGASAGVLARADHFADGLSGAPLAASVNGPLLLSPSNELDGRVAAELQRVLAPGSTVHLLGGTSALAPGVEQAVRDLGFTPIRHQGGDRYATAVAVADALGSPSTVILATGGGFPDALAAGAAAAHIDAVVLLTDGSTMPGATAAYIDEHAQETYAVGGPAADAKPDAVKIVGGDRYATAVAVATTFFDQPTTIGFATGASFPDALGAGAHAARADAPLLLVVGSPLPESVRDYLAANHESVTAEVLYGGTFAISETVRAQLHLFVAYA